VRLVSVAVPVPFLDALTYQVPDGVPQPLRGARVLVPLGKREVPGVVLGAGPEPATPEARGRIRPIAELLDDEPFLPDAIVDLAVWVAEYYACGVGDALAAAVPSIQPHKTMRVVALTAHGHDAQLRGRQKEAAELLRGVPAGLTIAEMSGRGISTDVLNRLATKGFVAFRTERVERDPFAGQSASRGSQIASQRVLTEEQARALAALEAAAATEDFGVFLLQGVTGSGKTEVYLRLADAVLQRGRSVLVLVPEIALTPAVAAAFRDAFGDRVAVQHSGLSSGERSDQWHRIRQGTVAVVVGTRSAVFAPLRNLGLIVVDEEHDTSFKQEETPRYNGRDVAVMRGKREKALVVLGSATPSLESSQNCSSGRYTRILMERRVQDRPLAAVSVVDMREEYAEHGPDVILSGRLKNAISQRISVGQQALILLNRRGLATAVFCRQCGGTIECPNCSVSLIIHSEGQDRHRARCHYCNYSVRVPQACPSCKGPYLERRGFGTERVAAEIVALWPHARVARLDRDTVRRKGAAADILRSMAGGTIDVLVGTQMIAKGHDFPAVTLVGVISADVGLGLADFRAAERTFQLLTQVAGRAGRGPDAGEAIVQTIYPQHYSIKHACRQDYAAFLADELRYRRAMRYPPLTALINLVIKGASLADALTGAASLAEQLRARAEAGRYAVLGPAPAAVAKLRGEYRAQLFLKGSQRVRMRDAVLAALAAEPDLRRSVTVDVDPLSVL
jgi:primosomal protein N' (replication factor Y)